MNRTTHSEPGRMANTQHSFVHTIIIFPLVYGIAPLCQYIFRLVITASPVLLSRKNSFFQHPLWSQSFPHPSSPHLRELFLGDHIASYAFLLLLQCGWPRAALGIETWQVLAGQTPENLLCFTYFCSSSLPWASNCSQLSCLDNCFHREDSLLSTTGPWALELTVSPPCHS